MTMMDIGEYAAMDAVALASAVARGDVSRSDVADAFRACVQVGDGLNAWAECYSDPDFSETAGPLAGVPVVRKDLGNPEVGRLKEYGTPLAEGLTSEVDSVFFRRLKAAGGVVARAIESP